ncbi:nucleoid-associated protein [Cohnella cellulosilytica]|uniref:Nucleoid-associated protein n=1 Tax=Cohnella cellulosilytica TaxID=986710 RepID=A0ABW2FAJ1_9BACL
MSNLTLKRLITHGIDLTQAGPTTFDRLMPLHTVPQEVRDFFISHIESALVAKQVQACIFSEEHASVLIDCVEIAADLTDDQVFIDNSKNMTQLLFNAMYAASTTSSGTLMFLQYFDARTNSDYLAILKMDPNKGIQLDLINYQFKVQKDMLPSVNEKLHKCAFIKLDENLYDEEMHLRVLDKQQLTGEVSKFFLKTFLGAEIVINDKAMTELVGKKLSEFGVAENIVIDPKQILDFNYKIDNILSDGREVDLEADLESLFKTYIPGDADRLHKIESFKQKLLSEKENAYYQFTANKKQTVAFFADSNNKIKIQFPVSYQDHSVFVDYEDEEDGSKTTVIRIKGVELKQKFK